MSDLEQRIARLEAIEAIKALKARYFQSCDSKRPQQVRDCFADGEVDTVQLAAIPRADDGETGLNVREAEFPVRVEAVHEVRTSRASDLRDVNHVTSLSNAGGKDRKTLWYHEGEDHTGQPGMLAFLAFGRAAARRASHQAHRAARGGVPSVLGRQQCHRAC